MFNSRNSNVQSNQSKQSGSSNKSSIAFVYKVILDVNDDILKDLEIPEAIRSKYIGAIQFRGNNTQNKKDEALSLALPYDNTNISLPTINESVRIINSEGGGFAYQRIISSPTPNINTGTNEITAAQQNDKGSSISSAAEYNKVQTTGIAKSSTNTNSDLEKYGDYFQPQLEIHKLRLYEGDNIIESRFGQSIRFRGYNNADNIFSPSVIIRNGENGESLVSGVGVSTEEDINKDGGIICLSSGERLLNYILPVDNKKESFFNYPNELRGNQILLNSDRLIFSAKTAEMIFASKKDTGFITDGQFSIDASRGVNITTDDNIYVDTKDKDINIDIGDGTIFLGTDGELEAVAKGETLVSLLGEMLDLIAQQIYLTPSGPTKAGPTNVAEFSALKSKLNSMLSNNVQVK